jgi:uncharacterized membrane protein YGL010W
MTALITSIKKMPFTVILAWLILLTIYVALLVFATTSAVFVGIAVGLVGLVWAVKRLLDYYI